MSPQERQQAGWGPEWQRGTGWGPSHLAGRRDTLFNQAQRAQLWEWLDSFAGISQISPLGAPEPCGIWEAPEVAQETARVRTFVQ